MVDLVEEWQAIFLPALGRRLVYAADEYYLLAGRPVPGARRPTRASPSTRTASAWPGPSRPPSAATPTPPAGPGPASSPRSTAPRRPATGHRDGGPAGDASGRRAHRPGPPVTILTGEYGARCSSPCCVRLRPRGPAVPTSGCVPVANRLLRGQHRRDRAPDRRRRRRRAGATSRTGTATSSPTRACPRAGSSTALTLDDLPRPVEVVATDGALAARALDGAARHAGVPAVAGRR